MKLSSLLLALSLTFSSIPARADDSESLDTLYSLLMMEVGQLRSAMMACGDTDPSPEANFWGQLYRIPDIDVDLAQKQFAQQVRTATTLGGGVCTDSKRELIATLKMTVERHTQDLNHLLTQIYGGD